MNPEQKLRELILKSEGKALEDELVFGCRVYLKEKPKDLFVVLKEITLGELDLLSIPENYPTHFLGHYEELEILGPPITLERVLRALGKKKKFSLRWDDTVVLGTKNGEIYWNLTTTTQTDETYTKLCELLTR